MLTITGLSLPAEANSTDENIELDEYEWIVYYVVSIHR